MAREPIAAKRTDNGAVEVKLSDGVTQYLPGSSEFAQQLAASLPDPMDGATAQYAGGPPDDFRDVRDREANARRVVTDAPPPAPEAASGMSGPPVDFKVVSRAENPYTPGSPEHAGFAKDRADSDRRIANDTPKANTALSGLANAMQQYTRKRSDAPAQGPAKPPAPPVRPQYTRGSPGHVVKGGPRLAGFTTKRTDVPEEAQDLLDSARDNRAWAGQLDAQAESDLHKREQPQAVASGVSLDYMADKNAEREAERIEAERESEERLHSLNAEIEEVGKETIDPDDYYKDKGLGERVMLSIAVFLAGVGNAKQYGGTGENMVLTMINDNIRRNIDAQKSNRANRKSALQDQRKTDSDLHSRMLARFGDERKADQAEFAAHQGEIAREIGRRAAEIKDPGRAAEMMRHKAALEEDRAKTLIDLNSVDVNETTVVDQDRRVGGSAPRIANPGELFNDMRNRGQSKEEALKNLAAMGVNKRTVGAISAMSGPLPPKGGAGADSIAKPENYVQWAGGYASSTADAAEMRNKGVLLDEVERSFNRLAELNSKGSSASLQDRDEAERISLAIAPMLSQLGGQGVINDSDIPFIEAQIPTGGNELFTRDSTFERRHKSAMDRLKAMRDSFKRNYTTPGEVAPVRGTGGRVNMRGTYTAPPPKAGDAKRADDSFEEAGK